MNRIFQTIRNDATGTFVAASENARGYGTKGSAGAVARAGRADFTLKRLAACMMLAFSSNAWALPTGGAVSAGNASIASIAGGAGKMAITQTSQNVAGKYQLVGAGNGTILNQAAINADGGYVALLRRRAS